MRAIRDNILLAQSFVADIGRDDFAQDRKSVYAVVRCLEIISEASRRVLSDVKERHVQIPWDQLRAPATSIDTTMTTSWRPMFGRR